MKLKKDLVLRKIAGENIVVPIGKLSQISPMMQITDSTAWLWQQMKDEDFTKIVNRYVYSQNGMLAWFLRLVYLLYKRMR